MAANDSQAAISTLCRQCTLCCTGVLFVDVQLQHSREIDFLEERGVDLAWDQKEAYLDQPCVCLGEQGCCRIYEHRPSMCVAFECSLLAFYLGGTRSLSDCQTQVQRAHAMIAEIESLLQTLGQDDRSIPLFYRIEEVLAQPWDLAEPALIQKQREKLFEGSGALSAFLEEHFLEQGQSVP
jgi:Fe-S-cluster containining protein